MFNSYNLIYIQLSYNVLQNVTFNKLDASYK